MSLAPPAPAPTSPPATRLRAATWRDPRLILGVVLVTVSVLVGSLVLARADDTVAVWAVRRGLPAGAGLAAGDLERHQVRLPDADLDRYVRVGRTSPAGARLSRDVGSGELLPRAAIASRTAASGVQLPLSVGVGDLPGAVRVGSVVDVWTTPAAATGQAVEVRPAHRVLRRVAVVAVAQRDDPLAPATTRALVVRVPDQVDLAEVLGEVAGSRVVVTVGDDR